MKYNYLILTCIFSFILFACSNSVDSSRNSSYTSVDSILYNLADEEYWNLLALFIEDPGRMESLKKNMEEIRFIWHDVFDTTFTVIQTGNARSRYIDNINSTFNSINIENKNLLNLHHYLINQKLNTQIELQNNVLKLSLVYADIMEQYMRSLSHNLTFDTIDFYIDENQSHFHVVPIFKSHTQYIGYIVNDSDTFYHFPDSIYLDKKRFPGSINIKVYGYEPNGGKYESSIKIN